jgi:hypothetical protein
MSDAETLFKEGMTFYKNGYWGKSLDKLREAVDLAKQNSWWRWRRSPTTKPRGWATWR